MYVEKYHLVTIKRRRKRIRKKIKEYISFLFMDFEKNVFFETYRVLPGSSSNSIKMVQPLIPHGSFSDIINISVTTLLNKSAGNNTSVHAKCLILASLSSICKRAVSTCNASSCDDVLKIVIGGS